MVVVCYVGKVLDEAKMSVYDWDRKDEDYINVTK